MGRKAQIQKAHRATVNVQKQQRQRRAEEAKDKRREGQGKNEEKDRRLGRLVEKRVAPDESHTKLLVGQMALAARVPGASNDLCFLLRDVVGLNDAHSDNGEETTGSSPAGNRRRAREEDEEKPKLTIKDNAEELLCNAVDSFVSQLSTLVSDEYGARAVCTLLNALKAFEANTTNKNSKVPTAEQLVGELLELKATTTDSKKKAEAEDEEGVEVEIDEEDADYLEPTFAPELNVTAMAQHHNARSVVWSMIENGSKKQQKRIAEALTPIATELATHRHGSIALLRLLEGGEKNATILAASLIPLIPTLVADPVGYNLAAALITDSNRLQIFEGLGGDGSSATSSAVVKNLANDKRGSRYLVRLLTLKATDEVPKEASRIVATIAERVATALADDLGRMAADRQGNFLFQAIFKASVSSVALQRKVYGFISNDLLFLCKHHVGVHVVLTLISHGDSKAVKMPLLQVLRNSLVDLVANQQGSLVVRSLIKASSADTGIYQMLEQHLETLMTDVNGNLVVQELLKCLTNQQKQAFVQKHIKKNLFSLCQHKFASHVIYALLDIADATTHNELCTTLKPNVVVLAQHVSGRFIVEKMAGMFKDVREQLLSNFTQLSNSQGTQNLLTQVFLASDLKTKQKLVLTVILPALAALGCNKNSSLVLQKMIQGEKALSADKQALVPELKKKLQVDRSLQQQLASDFFGRFIVENLKDGITHRRH